MEASKQSDSKKIKQVKTKRVFKATKITGAPKKPLSPYFIYLAEIRTGFKQKHPEMDQKELLTSIGKAWQMLPEGDKAKYGEKAAAKKQIYEEEVKKFESTDVYKDQIEKIKDKTPPKKPLSAFFFFLADRRLAAKKDNPKVETKELTTMLGKEWSDISAELKSQYEEKAKEAKKDYEVKYAEFLKNNPESKYKQTVDEILNPSGSKKSKKGKIDVMKELKANASSGSYSDKKRVVRRQSRQKADEKPNYKLTDTPMKKTEKKAKQKAEEAKEEQEKSEEGEPEDAQMDEDDQEAEGDQESDQNEQPEQENLSEPDDSLIQGLTNTKTGSRRQSRPRKAKKVAEPVKKQTKQVKKVIKQDKKQTKKEEKKSIKPDKEEKKSSKAEKVAKKPVKSVEKNPTKEVESKEEPTTKPKTTAKKVVSKEVKKPVSKKLVKKPTSKAKEVTKNEEERPSARLRRSLKAKQPSADK